MRLTVSSVFTSKIFVEPLERVSEDHVQMDGHHLVGVETTQIGDDQSAPVAALGHVLGEVEALGHQPVENAGGGQPVETYGILREFRCSQVTWRKPSALFLPIPIIAHLSCVPPPRIHIREFQE